MKHLALALALSLAAPVSAQTLIADAFGLYPAGSDDSRAAWSDLRTRLDQTATDAVDQGGTAGPADNVAIVFGPKSLVAGLGRAQAAALVLDAHGNLVADGTPVRLGAEDGTFERPTRHGIASRLVPAGPEAGRQHAHAATGSGEALRQSARVSYRVIPALSRLTTALIAPTAPLPPEEMLRLEADPLTGPFGAVPADGVAGAILLRHADGSQSFIPATWIGGALQAPWLSRDISGKAEAQILLPFSQTAPVPIEIARLRPGAALGLAATDLPAIGATRLLLGPFTTQAGHHLHDGSPVALRLTDAVGVVFDAETWLRDGRAEITVPSRARPFAITVTSPLGTASLTLAEGGQ